MTKYHRLGGLSSRKSFSHGSGGWKFEIKISTGLVSSEASFVGVQIFVFSLCLCRVFPLHVPVLISFDKGTSHIGLGPTLITSFDVITFLKDPSSNTVILRYYGLLQHVNFGRGEGNSSLVRNRHSEFLEAWKTAKHFLYTYIL